MGWIRKKPLFHFGTSGDTELMAFVKEYQTEAQRQRVRFGKEEQRRERALTFVKKSEQTIQSLLRRVVNELFLKNRVDISLKSGVSGFLVKYIGFLNRHGSGRAISASISSWEYQFGT